VAKLEIAIATWDYDRVRPIIDGRVELCCHSSFSLALFLMFGHLRTGGCSRTSKRLRRSITAAEKRKTYYAEKF
jgi:hypothetical protein